jgi:hypothetical protein
MRRMLTSLSLTALLAAVTAGAALATKPPQHPGSAANGKKVWICHRTHSARNPYVAIRIPAKQLVDMNGHGAPQMRDVLNATPTATAPVPQSSKAARAYCRSLVAMTPRTGGHRGEETLTPSAGATVTGSHLVVRLRLGQAEICVSATVTSATAPSVTVTGISLTQGTVTTDLSGFTSPLPTNATLPLRLATCAPLNRTVVASILHGTLTLLTISTSSGNLTATLP